MIRIDKRLITRQKNRLLATEQKFLPCRVGGVRHLWLRVQPDWQPSNQAHAVAYQCSSCSTVKRMEIDPKYGFVIGQARYEYPDGYQMKRSEGDGTETLSSPNAVRSIMATIPIPAGQVIE